MRDAKNSILSHEYAFDTIFFGTVMTWGWFMTLAFPGLMHLEFACALPAKCNWTPIKEPQNSGCFIEILE